MNHAHEINRLADRAIEKLGLRETAERLTGEVVAVFEAKMGRLLASHEVQEMFALLYRWLSERRSISSPALMAWAGEHQTIQ